MLVRACASTSLTLALAGILMACGGGGTSSSDSASETSSDSEAESETTGGTESSTDTDTDTDTDTEGDTTGEPLPPAEVPEGCNPVAYAHDCMLPYPSDVFLVDEPNFASGKRVELTPEAKPKTNEDVGYDFTEVHPVDGFSRHQPILTIFPEGVDQSNITFHQGSDPEASLMPDHPTILLNAETGEPVPHWAELDRSTELTSDQAFIVRPFVRLDNETRYIVAFQHLNDAAGSPIVPPLGFAHLLAGDVDGHPVLEPLAARYETEIFPLLEQHGVERADLQLAWDFTTGSDTHNTRDLLQIRDDAVAQFEQNPPEVTVTAVLPDYSEQIALRIEGRLTVPLYLENEDPGALLNRDGDGNVVQNGTAEVPFTLQVPVEAIPADENFEPLRMLQYGHGFFGLREEINYSFMRGFTNEQKYLAAAVDWWGMSEPDQITILSALGPGGNVSEAFKFVDRVHQAMVNQIALTYALLGPITELEELQQFGKLLYDPQKLYYYGISQGSIFGTTFISLSPQIERAVLSVGGGPYSLMMSRSASFRQLYDIALTRLPNDLTMQKFMTLSQHTFDRVDPMTYAHRLVLDPYPNSPERKILIQVGIGDHSVNNLASHLHSRAAGIGLLTPAPREIYGLDTLTAPVDNATVEVDFMLEQEPGIDAALPTEDELNGVHEDVRRNAKIKEQIDLFFQPNGQIEHTCDGPCDPE